MASGEGTVVVHEGSWATGAVAEEAKAIAVVAEAEATDVAGEVERSAAEGDAGSGVAAG